MMHELYKYLLELFRNLEWISEYAKPVAALTVIVTILLVARFSHYLTKHIAGYFVKRIVLKTKNEWDDILLKRKVFNGFAHLNQDMSFIVRQLQSTDKGVPIEVYVFSKEKEWVRFETIQADIFDHLFAVIPEFDLKVYQAPTGYDTRSLFQNPPYL
jgi:hypothetical protein